MPTGKFAAYFFSVVIAFFVGIVVSHAESIHMFLALVAMGLLGILRCVLVTAKPVDIFSPSLVILAVYVLAFIVPAFPRLLGAMSDVSAPYYIMAIVYAFLSLIVFLLAYQSDAGRILARSAPQLKRAWDHRRVPLVVAAFSLIGLGGHYAAMQSVGGIGYYVENIGDRIGLTAGRGYLFQLRNFATAANLLWLVSMLARGREGKRIRRTEIALYALHLLIVLAVLLTLGSRGTVLYVPLMMMLVWHFLWRRVGLKQVMSFCLASTLFVYGYGVLRSLTIADALYAARDEFLGRVLSEEMILGFISSGLSDGARMVAGIVASVGDEVGLQWGRTYWNLVYFPIPRNMFEVKPKTGGEIVTEEIFYRVSSPGREYLSPTMIGEAYLNFHVVGILLASFTLGIVSRALYVYMTMKSGNPSSRVVVGAPLLVILYLFPSGEFINSASDVIKAGVNALGVFLIARKATTSV